MMTHTEVRSPANSASQLHCESLLATANFALSMRSRVAAVAEHFPIAQAAPQIGAMTEVAETAAVTIALVGKAVK